VLLRVALAVSRIGVGAMRAWLAHCGALLRCCLQPLQPCQPCSRHEERAAAPAAGCPAALPPASALLLHSGGSEALSRRVESL
jgi:hypothetical protein